ncbi:transporter [Urechidicola croceus]|uniref:Transporter n=1 Tax=Urechidicola croceus TaxID=1850246 RepID=A0A1D8PBH0_9FLAO|nr:transporter [Urechidicola croceus]AOW21928.1 hypothetical protein LPB138_15075 [Urechidicola croceus]
MKKNWLIAFLLFSFQIINAQYTEIINSKRPGLSESPYGVGTDVLQFEGGFFFGKSESDRTFARINPIGTNLFIRYGKFIERLEINANVTFQKEELQFNNIFTSTSNISGISQLTIGAKYLIYQQEFTDKSKEIRSWKKRTAFDKKRLIPSVGIYLGVNTNFLGKDYEESGISPKAAILLQNDFTDRLVLITNIIGDKIGTDYPIYSYITTLTYATSDRWSIFMENQGDFTKYRNDFQVGTGVAYLYSSNLQFDASIRASLNTEDSALIAGIGASWRLDKHVDQEIETDENGNKIKSKKRRRGGLFSRIFKKKK